MMNAIDVLKTRVSHGKLTEPGPSEAIRSEIESCALRAADHGNLRPWRFLYIEGLGRKALGELFLKASKVLGDTLSDAQEQRYLAMPMRAPCIYVAIARIVEHPKVPRDEQMMTAAAATQNMINAAFALGVGAYWRSGDLATNNDVKQGLGLAENELIIGFVYMGTPLIPGREAPVLNRNDFFDAWPSK